MQILAERGYVVKERGIISVKGKGQMLTFYVIGRKISRSWRFGKTVNQVKNFRKLVTCSRHRSPKIRIPIVQIFCFDFFNDSATNNLR